MPSNAIIISISDFLTQYGDEDDTKSFLLELTWGENYPNEPPKINLDTFYNRNMYVFEFKIHFPVKT